MADTEVMPVGVAIRFAHAAAQAVADEQDIRVLHIKGPAVDPALLDVRPAASADDLVEPMPRRSVDADVWVDPSRIPAFMAALGDRGWDLKVAFKDGSAFEHDATLGHPLLGHLDVHRYFPGIGLDPQAAFDRLWREQGVVDIAGRPCWVPSVPAQRLVLLLHAARGGVRGDHPDVRRTWWDADEREQAEVRSLAEELHAEVALAAVTGDLERYRGRRERWLWRILSEPGGRRSMVEIWAARVWAEPTPLSAGKTAFRLLMPKPQRLRLNLDRPPTRGEIVRAYKERIVFGVREFGRWVRR